MADHEQNALISVYDKTDIEKFAAGLVELDWNIYASGGTATRIGEAGIPVTDVKELAGGAAILNHQVVTLSRNIYAGILADPSNEEHMAELEEERIPLISLVCVDMYPLKDEIEKPGATPQSVRAQTDIGGPTMLRAAAKGRKVVLAHSEQREPVLEWLRDGQPDSETYRLNLAAAAELAAGEYAMSSGAYLIRLAAKAEPAVQDDRWR